MKITSLLTHVLLGVFAAFAGAQTLQTAPAPPTAPPAATALAAPLPTDPNALLQLAADSNGLHGAGLKPWHTRATWQTLDDQKQIKAQGIFEEWWGGEKKYKMSWKSADVDRTYYGTDHGLYLVKRSAESAWQFSNLQRLITTPVAVPKPGPQGKSEARLVDLNQGAVALHCVVINETFPNGSPMMVRVANGNARPLEIRNCFSGDLPAVRSQASSDGGQTVFNGIVRFQGRYLSTNIRSVGAGGVETDINVATIEPIDSFAEADFTPPPEASLVPAAVASGVMAGYRIAGDPPQYPEPAKMSRTEGTVVLRATISKEGRIKDLSVLSGPSMLQQAAMDAVKTWRYKPYLLEGDPVEVETQINVVFALGH
jgi:TonB family protein